MAPRVRFAPSPTGYLHVGGARTALLNWLFARRHGGTFLLRIEDTDAERSSQEMVTGILESLRWLELDWDEGPYYQSQRLELYRATAERVLQAGLGFRCFCRPGLGERTVRDPCRALTAEESERRAGESKARFALDGAGADPFAIRFRTPDAGSTVFDDAVFGRVEFANSDLEDFVLLRSDRMPTYHLSVVADDLEMRITHVIRGADHLSNTPKQALLYQALDAATPIFAHVPLILGPDRTRLSKRHGATSVSAYRETGLLPEAFRNFLALLGWAPGDNRELLNTQELIAAFTLQGISKSNAVFNIQKLEWFNQQYMQSYAAGRLLPFVREELEKAALWSDDMDRDWLLRALDLLKPRMRTLQDFTSSARAFFTDRFSIDPTAAEKFWKDPALAELLSVLAEQMERAEPFDAATAEAALRGLADRRGVKAALLINASRVALTGQAVAPSLFQVMALLGRDRTVGRLRAAGEMLHHKDTKNTKEKAP